jgi:hypothetical protein
LWDFKAIVTISLITKNARYVVRTLPGPSGYPSPTIIPKKFIPPAYEMIVKQKRALPEDIVDDLLYFARAGETDDLVATLKGIASDASSGFASEAEVLLAAQDSFSGNNVLHMAAGNGHLGYLLSFPVLVSQLIAASIQKLSSVYYPSYRLPTPPIHHTNSSPTRMNPEIHLCTGQRWTAI